MVSPKPSPISWDPSEYWDGNDGLWSTFTLRVGVPAQSVRVLVSTAGQATWVIVPEGCQPGPFTATTCTQDRGGVFSPNASESSNVKGDYALGLRANFGENNINATYSLDTVALGFSNTTGGPILQSQVVAGLASSVFYLGLFGLGTQPTNFTTLDDSHSSFLTALKSADLIPTLSWSYTAGAHYQLKGSYGSLTFGGFDQSRFYPNEVSFSLGADVSRDLVVGLQSITSRNSTGQFNSLLPSPIFTFVDSTSPYIYLPAPACQLFEEIFGLVFDPQLGMYTVNDDLHRALLASNPNITFTIGNDKIGGSTVDIALPYASFDLTATFPLVPNSTRYFPLKKAANDTQYTLGRAFLQEAYLITDYEHRNFSISQCRFENGLAKDIVAITTASLTSQTSPPASAVPTLPPSHHMSLGVVIGIISGSVSLLLLSLLIVILCVKRRRSLSQKATKMSIPRSSILPGYQGLRSKLSVQEIDRNSLCGYLELDDNGLAELQDRLSYRPQDRKPNARVSVREVKDNHSLRMYEKMVDSGIAELQAETPSTHDQDQEAPSPDQLDKHVACWDVIEVRDNTRRNFQRQLSLCPLAGGKVGHKMRERQTEVLQHMSTQEKIGSRPIRRTKPNLNRTLPVTPISESPQTSQIITEVERAHVAWLITTNERARNVPHSKFIDPPGAASKMTTHSRFGTEAERFRANVF